MKVLSTPLQVLSDIWKILSGGIRAKLAWFTGTLIALTIFLLSILTVKQQTEILTESYEKQAAVSKNFIASLVTEIETISQNMIRVEEFKSRIERQKEELKKYKTTKVVSQENTVSVFGFKTNLFGSLGQQKVVRKVDSFFSVYLTPEDVKILEKEIKQQLNEAANQNLSEKDWQNLVRLAKAFVKAEEAYADLQKKIESESNPEVNPNTIPNQPAEKDQKAKKESKKKVDYESLKKQAQKNIRDGRSKLDRAIGRLYADSKKRKLEELGLDTKLFRIQTFPTSAIVDGETTIASFDTKFIDDKSAIAQFVDLPEMEEGLLNAFSEVNQNTGAKQVGEDSVFQWENREIQTSHSPLYRNPNSTRRAFRIIFAKQDLGEFDSFVDEDDKIVADLKILIPKIKERLKVLKNSKPPIPPSKDKIFAALYKDYSNLIERRELSFDKILTEEIQTNPKFESWESLRSLRDSALEDWILLKFKSDQSEYEKYYQNPEDRELHRKRWKAIRKWISSAEQETPTKELKRLFPDGSIGNSRSEAEEILWKLDSLPLFGDDSIANFVLKSNFSGLVRTLVDRTDGIRAIRDNRNQIVYTAITICGIAILFAIFISGVVVQKIRKIIRSAEDVGKGNLNVEFEHGGNDEFGNLTIALNSMVSGLKDREKMRGVLGSMVDPVVVTEALKDLEKLKRGSEKIITAFFSDIAGFSAISEKLSSVDLAKLLNEYLSAMTIILKKHDGVLDKYIGDAIVGIFNAPLDVEEHCLKAATASLEMVQKLEELKSKWKSENSYIEEAQNMSFRIGLNLGYAKVGFMGTDALASYTMMGDTVNLAARLEAAGKDYNVKILASEFVMDAVKDSIFARKLDFVRVKGKQKPVTLYEIRAILGTESEDEKKFVSDYEEALFQYQSRHFAEAKLSFSRLVDKTKDKASKVLAERCDYYLQNPPPSDWDGAFTRTKK